MRAHEFITENISGNYLYHATSADGLKGILQSGAIEQAYGPQHATNAQTQLPTVSLTRSWAYASGKGIPKMINGIGRDAILIFDRNTIETRYKILNTSQSGDVRGLPYAKKSDYAKVKMNRYTLPDTNKDGVVSPEEKEAVLKQHPEIAKTYFLPKAGGEFEEVVVVPKGSLPIAGNIIGFWVNPKSELIQDPEIMNHPMRVELTGPNRFKKANIHHEK